MFRKTNKKDFKSNERKRQPRGWWEQCVIIAAAILSPKVTHFSWRFQEKWGQEQIIGLGDSICDDRRSYAHRHCLEQRRAWRVPWFLQPSPAFDVSTGPI